MYRLFNAIKKKPAEAGFTSCCAAGHACALGNAQRHGTVASSDQLAAWLAHCILHSATTLGVKVFVGVHAHAMIHTQAGDGCGGVLEAETCGDLCFGQMLASIEGLEQTETFAFWIKTHDITFQSKLYLKNQLHRVACRLLYSIVVVVAIHIEQVFWAIVPFYKYFKLKKNVVGGLSIASGVCSKLFRILNTITKAISCIIKNYLLIPKVLIKESFIKPAKLGLSRLAPIEITTL